MVAKLEKKTKQCTATRLYHASQGKVWALKVPPRPSPTLQDMALTSPAYTFAIAAHWCNSWVGWYPVDNRPPGSHLYTCIQLSRLEQFSTKVCLCMCVCVCVCMFSTSPVMGVGPFGCPHLCLWGMVQLLWVTSPAPGIDCHWLLHYHIVIQIVMLTCLSYTGLLIELSFTSS